MTDHDQQSAEARTLPLFPEKARMTKDLSRNPLADCYQEAEPITPAKPRAKPGPKALDLVDLHAKILKRHRTKIERVRKQQRLETTSQALRFMLEEWG